MSRSGLASRYRGLLIALAFNVVQGAALALLVDQPRAYALTWAALQPIGWMVQSYMVWEIFSLWTERYPGIGVFGRWLLVWFSVIAIAGGAAIGWRSYSWLEWAKSMRAIYVLRSAATFALATFLLLTIYFFRYLFRPSAARNLVRHTWISLAIFLALGFRLLLFGSRAASVVALQFALLVLWLVCHLAWLIGLVPAGERVWTSDRNQLDEEAIARVDSQITEGLRSLGVVRRLRSWLW